MAEAAGLPPAMRLRAVGSKPTGSSVLPHLNKMAPARGNDPRLTSVTNSRLTPCQPDRNKVMTLVFSIVGSNGDVVCARSHELGGLKPRGGSVEKMVDAEELESPIGWV